MNELVELLGIIFYLSGAKEYSDCKVISYINAINSYFNRNHRVIELAKRLHQSGVSYNVVPCFALKLEKIGDEIRFKDSVEIYGNYKERFPHNEEIKFLKEINDFYKTSNFNKFFEEQKTLRNLVDERFTVNKYIDFSWFESFFGYKNQTKTIASIINGPHSYGPTIIESGKEVHIQIIGSWRLDEQGFPIYPENYVHVLIHEMCHPYCNPLIDEYISDLYEKANKIMSSNKIPKQYNKVQVMLYETLVRACVICYYIKHDDKINLEELLKKEEELGFVLIRLCVEALRNKETALGDYMPELIRYINEKDD